MPSDLYQGTIGSSSEAPAAFGSNPGLVVAQPSRGFLPYIVIPEGYYALVTSNGAEILHPESNSRVWSSGLYTCGPWVRISHLVSKGHIVYDTPCKGCKTKDNVTVRIDVNTVFRIMGDASLGEDPNLVPKFVHEVTPKGLQQQLRDAIDEAVRMLARSMKHQEVYGLRSITIMGDGTVVNMTDEGGFASAMQNVTPVLDSKMVEEKGTASVELAGAGIQLASVAVVGEDRGETKLFEGAHNSQDVDNAISSRVKGEWATSRVIQILNDQFMPQGVKIVDVMITNVELPEEITKKMTSKTMVISQNAEEIMTQQYEMQELKFSEELKKMNQTFAEDREQEKQDGAFARNEATVRLNGMKADTDKQIKLLQQANTVNLKQIQAEADLEVTKLEQDRSRIVTELSTQSSAKAASIQAHASQYCVQKNSEAELEVQRNDAKAMEVLSEAEGIIAPLLQQFNEHEVHKLKLRVLEALASNADVVITPGGTTADTQTLMLVDQILSKTSGKSTRSEMLSELMLMRAGGNVALNPSTGATILASGGR